MKLRIQRAETFFYSIRSVQGEDIGEIEVTKDELKFLNKATKKYIRAQKMIASKLPQKQYRKYTADTTIKDKQIEANEVNTQARVIAWEEKVKNG